MAPFPYDLFGEIPVTQADVDAWLATVPKLAHDSPKRAYYIRGWNVVEKIRAAKRRGDFLETVAGPCPICGAELHK